LDKNVWRNIVLDPKAYCLLACTKKVNFSSINNPTFEIKSAAYRVKYYQFLGVCFLGLLLTLSPHNVRAGHVLGSELTYVFSNPSVVNLQLKVYRDCNECKFNGKGGGNNPDNCSDIPAVEVYGLHPTQGRVLLTTVSMTTRSIQSILPTCSGISNTCSPSVTPDFGGGIEAHELEGNFSFQQFEQQGYCHFYFASAMFSRSNAITPLGQPIPRFFNYSELRICEGQRVSSVTLDVMPNFYVNAGQSIYHSPGIKTGPKDSVAVSLVPALSAFDAEIPYVTGRTFSRPVEVKCLSATCNSNPQIRPPLGLSVEPQTGNTVFFPEVAGQFGTLVYEIKQFTLNQNNQWVFSGIVRRDFQIYTLTASNREPVFENLQTHFELCAGVDFVLPIPVSDNQQVTYQVLNARTGMVLSTSSLSAAPFATANLLWKPTVSDQGNVYLVTVTVRDANCPINAISSRTYRLRVNDNPLLSAQITQDPCGQIKMQASPPTFADNHYIWRITYPNTLTQELWGRSQEIQFTSGGTLHIELSLNQFCRGTTQRSIQVPAFTLPTFTLPDTHFACFGTFKTLQATQLIGNAPFSYFWNEKLGGPSYTFEVKSEENITLRVQDRNGCQAERTTFVYSQPLLPLQSKDSSFCSYDTGLFSLNSLVTVGPQATVMQFNLLGGGTQLLQAPIGSWFFDKQQFSRSFIHFSVQVKDETSQCITSDTFTVFKNTGLAPEDKSLGPFCVASAPTDLYKFFKLKTTDGKFELQNHVNAITELGLLQPSLLTPGKYMIQFTSTAVYCNKVFMFPFEIKPLPSLAWIKQHDRWVCKEGSPLALGGDASGIWSGLGVDNGYFYPTHASLKEFEPIVLQYNYLEEQTLCSIQDTIQLIVIPSPTYALEFFKNGVAITDNSVCESQSPIEFYVKPLFNELNYPGSLTHLVSPLNGGTISGNLYYLAGVSNGKGVLGLSSSSSVCPEKFSEFSLDVLKMPEVKIATLTETMCSGRDKLELSYQSQNATHYFWQLNGVTVENQSEIEGFFLQDALVAGNYELTLTVSNAKCVDTLIIASSLKVYPSPEPYIQSFPGKYIPYDLKIVELEDKGKYTTPITKREWRVEGMPYYDKTKIRHGVIAEEGQFIATLMLEDEHTCTGNATTLFEITSPLDLYIPNAFSPNGKGPEANNVFKVQAQHVQSFELVIFNRWGEEVFKTKDPEKGWDGTFLGVPSEMGVYAYFVKVTNHLGGTREFKGTLSLIR